MDAWIAWLQISLALLLFVLSAQLLASLHQSRRDGRRLNRHEEDRS